VAPVREEEFFALRKRWRGDAGKALQLFGDELRRKAKPRRWRSRSWRSGKRRPQGLADSARYAGSGERELGYNEFQAKLFPASRRSSPRRSRRSRIRSPRGWLQAVAEKAARILAPGAGALRGGGLRAEGRRDPRLALERLLVEVCAR